MSLRKINSFYLLVSSHSPPSEVCDLNLSHILQGAHEE